MAIFQGCEGLDSQGTCCEGFLLGRGSAVDVTSILDLYTEDHDALPLGELLQRIERIAALKLDYSSPQAYFDLNVMANLYGCCRERKEVPVPRSLIFLTIAMNMYYMYQDVSPYGIFDAQVAQDTALDVWNEIHSISEILWHNGRYMYTVLAKLVAKFSKDIYTRLPPIKKVFLVFYIAQAQSH